MTTYLTRADMQVAEPIAQFAEESLTRHGFDHQKFWAGVSSIVHELGPKNADLLNTRHILQEQIDEYHRQRPGTPDPAHYAAFLTEIGYLEPEPAPFTASTTNVVPEIATLAGPQLVVPLLNARFAINAANARWGSLYDALYGSDVIAQSGDLAPGTTYNDARGAEVIAQARAFLDNAFPLTEGNHSESVKYSVTDNALVVELTDGRVTTLRETDGFAGYSGTQEDPSVILLRHHGLHVEMVIDRAGRIGATDLAGVQDIVLESAITTIMDLEDSVAAVDADDKSLGYRNWRGLMNGSLTTEVAKGDTTFVRTLNSDRQYTGADGSPLMLPGQSVLFIRNVGHLMRGPSILDRDGNETFEGIIDAIMTALGSLDHPGVATHTDSIYIVKPKMHGSAEVAFTVELFGRVEALLNLPALTMKVGIMDEERRTSANLAACIAAASDRVVFINTGFLDRTGDEMHTSMHAGPFLPKAAMRTATWLGVYEDRNVAIGVACGLDGVGQIGKGMWAMPDLMADMLEQKIQHVRSGASTAWVPSPTAATLHAIHYHQLDAFEQRRALPEVTADSLTQLLEIPLAQPKDLTPAVVQGELDNNVQLILGYVSRWIDQGIGCSKVPDLNNTFLMEDRATLRISSQLLTNWLLHGVITEAQVTEALKKFSAVVDQQNADDPVYETLISEAGPGIAFTAAQRLILEGRTQPSGYTEPILHALRLAKKAESK